MKIKKISAKEAYKILKDTAGDDGITFYALNTESNEVYAFDTKAERDSFVSRLSCKEE